MMHGSCRGPAVWLVGLFFAAIFAVASPAAAADLFSVSGVPVDATANSAADARVQALAAGQRAAYRELLQRLTLRTDWSRLPMVDEPTLNELVQGIEIADERTSSTRYIANLTVSFHRDGIEQLLRQSNIPFTETAARPALVLPVYQTDAGMTLWGDPNPWRDVWANLSTRGSLVTLLAPLGDIEDVNAISAEQAASGDADRLKAVAQRYGAADVLVAQAVAGPRQLDVTVTRYGSTGPQAVVQSFPGEVGPELLQKAASTIAAQLEENWKQQTLLRFGEPAMLSVNIPVRDLQDWLSIQQKLRAAAPVRQLEISALTRSDAQVVIHYLGDPNQLATALVQHGLTLAEEQGFWSLRQSGGGQGAAAKPSADQGGAQQQAPAASPAAGTGGGQQSAPATQ